MKFLTGIATMKSEGVQFMSEIIKQEYIHLHCPAATKAEVLQTASRWAAEAELSLIHI